MSGSQPNPVDPGLRTPPATLRLAALLTGIEALAALLIGVVELFHARAGHGVETASVVAFFVLYAAALAACAWGLAQLRPWSRSPVVMVQLLTLELAWNWHNAPTTWAAIPAAIAAVVTLVCVLAPDSMRALDR